MTHIAETELGFRTFAFRDKLRTAALLVLDPAIAVMFLVPMAVLVASAVDPMEIAWMAAAVLLVASFLAAILAWHIPDELPPVHFRPGGFSISPSLYSSDPRSIAYSDVRSIHVHRSGPLERLMIDTSVGLVIQPVGRFLRSDAPQVIQETIRTGLPQGLQGSSIWRAIEKRDSQISWLQARTCVCTYLFVGLLLLVFLDQRLHGYREVGLLPASWGANYGILVFAGQWYRLAIANFLHANPMHIMENVLCIIVLGTRLEPLLGKARFVSVLLFCGLLSQLATASAEAFTSYHLYSVGASGMFYGMVGAFGILNLRYRDQLPAQYRCGKSIWWGAAIGYLITVPLTLQTNDHLCHLFGFVGGAGLCWAFVRGNPTVDDLIRHRPRAWPAVAAALAAVYLYGAAVMIRDTRTTGAKDLALLLQTYRDRVPHSQGTDNAVAWAIATDRRSSPSLIRGAQELAQRALAEADRRKDHTAARTYTDTLATVEYRLGLLRQAAQLEQTLLDEPNVIYQSQFARFLYAEALAFGPRVLDEAHSGTRLSAQIKEPFSADSVNRLRFPVPLRGNSSWLVGIEAAGHLQGILDVRISDELSSAILLPAQMVGDAANYAHGLQFRILQADLSGCSCRAGDRSVKYYSLAKSVMDLP